jgi:cell division control protein 7
MELDPTKRLSAEEALNHEFFTDPILHDVEWGGHPEEGSVDSEEEEDEAGENEADEVAML